MAIVLALSASDAILYRAGRQPSFDAVGLIDRIAAHPGDPSLGWIYFTLLCTLLPSFCNLLVGIFSLLTFFLPPLRRWLIATIPTLDGPGLGGTRWRVVFVLSAHWFCGVLLTGLGLWLVWKAAFLVPGAEEMALQPLRAFAVWIARLLGLPNFAAGT